MAKKKWWEYSVQDKLREKRILLLFDEINIKTSRELIRQMIAMDLANSKEPIWLYINSIGGYVPAGLAIIDTMKTLKSPVYTVIIGEACSMGSVVSVCGDKRFITPNSYFMGHPLTFGAIDYAGVVVDRVNYGISLQELLINIYKKHTRLNKKDFEKMLRGELWLNARQCLKKKVADEILEGIE